MIIDEKIFTSWLFFNAINHAIFTQLIDHKEVYYSSLDLLNTNNSKFEIEMIKSLPKLTQLLNKRGILDLFLRKIEKEKRDFLRPSKRSIDFLKDQEDQKIKEIKHIDKELEIYFLYIYKKIYSFLKLKQSAPYLIREINESEKGKAMKKDIFTNILPFINSFASYILREKNAIPKLLHNAMLKKILLEKDNQYLKRIGGLHGEIHPVQFKKLPHYQLEIKGYEKLNWMPLLHSMKDLEIKAYTNNDITIELITAKDKDLIADHIDTLYHIDTLLNESSYYNKDSLRTDPLKSSPLHSYKSKAFLKKEEQNLIKKNTYEEKKALFSKKQRY